MNLETAALEFQDDISTKGSYQGKGSLRIFNHPSNKKCVEIVAICDKNENSNIRIVNQSKIKGIEVLIWKLL